jgi:tetraacyldisaccharide 4'-kinase
MNFKLMVSVLRVLAFPFSLLYGVAVLIRNKLFDYKIIPSHSFSIPVICIGNISTGGTGKSPMVDFLVKCISQKYKPGIISRGYKRSTKGYLLATDESTPFDLGDEPYMLYKKNAPIAMAVGEDRVQAITQLLIDKQETNVVIMDDGYQHRKVTPSFSILLTDYQHLFYNDFFLPTGNLRDIKSRALQADTVVVTKCPELIQEHEKNQIIRKMKLSQSTAVFFTTIQHDQLYHLVKKTFFVLDATQEILLVTGIANTKSIEQMLTQNGNPLTKLSYPDHHQYSDADISHIIKTFDRIKLKNKIILTTEKDAVRLEKFKLQFSELPIYVLPMKIKFLFDGERQFSETILNHIDTFQKTS